LPYRFDIARFILIIVTALLMVVFFSFGGLFGTGATVKLGGGSLVLVLIIIACVAAGLSFTKVIPSKEDVDITTESRCPSCGFLLQRAFENGDFISKPDKPCPKDGATTIIQKIYTTQSSQEKTGTVSVGAGDTATWIHPSQHTLLAPVISTIIPSM
jgi:hypothetical protein